MVISGYAMIAQKKQLKFTKTCMKFGKKNKIKNPEKICLFFRRFVHLDNTSAANLPLYCGAAKSAEASR
jgi:hypothetical protein